MVLLYPIEREMVMDLLQDIKESEGLELTAYWDEYGKVWTIGYGSTFYEDGSPVKEGDKITKKRAEELLKWYVDTQITQKVGIINKLNDYQKRAVFSLVYNIGYVQFNNSQLKKHIVANDIEGIYKNWDWISSGGKPLKGLARRRAKELALYFT